MPGGAPAFFRLAGHVHHVVMELMGSSSSRPVGVVFLYCDCPVTTGGVLSGRSTTPCVYIISNPLAEPLSIGLYIRLDMMTVTCSPYPRRTYVHGFTSSHQTSTSISKLSRFLLRITTVQSSHPRHRSGVVLFKTENIQ